MSGQLARSWYCGFCEESVPGSEALTLRLGVPDLPDRGGQMIGAHPDCLQLAMADGIELALELLEDD